MRFIREQISRALASGETVNRRLVVLVGLAVAALVAILVSLNSVKSIPAVGVTTPVSTPFSLPEIYVHIVGEVAKPGIYNLNSDSRVFDAIFAAGGFTVKAEQSSVNLARALNDGERIIVLNRDSPNKPIGAAGTTDLISLNLGDLSDLEKLPGVGPTLAARIIDWRLANGGFKKFEDLKRVSGIGSKLYAQIKAKATL